MVIELEKESFIKTANSVAALILPSSCGPEDGREEGGLAAAVAAVDAVDRLGWRHVGGETVLSAPDILPAIKRRSI